MFSTPVGDRNVLGLITDLRMIRAADRRPKNPYNRSGNGSFIPNFCDPHTVRNIWFAPPGLIHCAPQRVIPYSSV